MIGSFTLSKGEIIHILVGQEGTINNSPQYPFASGGGGGTFVVRGGSTPLIIAGGGGGIDTLLSRQPGCDASISKQGILDTDHGQGGAMDMVHRLLIMIILVRL